ncbi:DUF7379 domain-containing protein [Sulfurovum mangrovi]|uniref:DUF7379 domain-containing protein n=1 Tax=Sulfurovum mangrovi TaxID=2893889 RepID=UPI001E283745|nr:CHAT domain-containing protein [Sulfurovum mangrovi]UFH60360.1 CHAT domain-containing protein [Sulfurovum mangrovi]
MKQSTTTDGSITFTLPDSASDIEKIEILPEKVRRRGEAISPDASSELAQILKALTEEESEKPENLVHGFSVDVGEGRPVRTRRGEKTEKPESLSIDVTLNPEEDAVILIEQDGAYEWHFPEKVAEKKRRLRRGGPSVVASKSAHFNIPIGEGRAPRKRRGDTRVFGGAVTNYIKGKVIGFVLKFVVRKAVGALSRRLEKGVKPGPVIITSATDTQSWKHEQDYSNVKLPKERPARILLLIHGTFSSTEGSFGALTEYEEGQNFLDRALQYYDAVLAYDHHTLADTPEQNAEEIFKQLNDLQKCSNGGIVIDAISFSRGGLVYRYLTEQIVPKEHALLSFDKAIFVGCTNAGTELANDENWKTLVDFYTTMVAGASRLLALHPGSRVAGEIMNQGIKIIGSLVKYMAQGAVADNGVPGLAAMRPEGSFVKAINAIPSSRTRSGARRYYAIGSDFEPGPDTSAGKLGRRMALKVADGVVDRLMGKKNDLVVHRSSMFVIDPISTAGLSDKMAFDRNGEIYHTVYFHQPQVARQCAEWLGLQPSGSARIGDTPREWWASEVSRDFTTLPSSMNVDVVARTLEDDNSRFVVLEREHNGERLHYGISRSELETSLDTISNRNIPLDDALGMHESDARSITLDEALDSSDIDGFRSKTASISSPLPGGETHAVILDETGPVGVAASPEIITIEKMEEETLPKRRRSAKRSSLRSPKKEAEPLAPGEVWCYAHAAMQEEALLNKKSTVEVTLSRDEIMLAAGATSRGSRGKVQSDKDLIIQVQARKHCILSGESRIEVPVPAPNDDTLLYFDIIPKYEGVGEVRIIVRQGNRPIANLKLFPRFVTTATTDVIGMASAEADLIPADNRTEIKNVLFIREAQMGDKRVLDFDFDFEVDGKKYGARGRSEPFENGNVRIDYITNLYKEIEDFWAESASDYEAFMFQLRARGAEIFKKLIPKKLQSVLWEQRDKIKAIQVFSDEPFIPWELAYLVEPGNPISPDSHFLAEKGMVRGYSNPDGITQMAPTKLRCRKNMARYVIPDYPAASGLQLPAAKEEQALLEELCKAQPIKPDKRDVVTAMMQPDNFDILHFACHGTANPNSIWDAGLLMQGKMQGNTYKEEKLLSSEVEGYAKLQHDGSPGPLVFLNACQIGRTGYSLTGTGGFARAFMKQGAGAFIGTHWSIGDNSALEFTKTFYTQLKEGKNMMSAVTAARKAAKNNQEVTWLSYVIYADPYAKVEIEE